MTIEMTIQPSQRSSRLGGCLPTGHLAEIEARLDAAPLDAGWYVADDGSVWVAHDPEHTSCSGITGPLPAWAGGAANLIANAPTDIAALAKLARVVEALHVRRVDRPGAGCRECGQIWPCPTAAAVQKADELRAPLTST